MHILEVDGSQEQPSNSLQEPGSMVSAGAETLRFVWFDAFQANNAFTPNALPVCSWLSFTSPGALAWVLFFASVISSIPDSIASRMHRKNT